MSTISQNFASPEGEGFPSSPMVTLREKALCTFLPAAPSLGTGVDKQGPPAFRQAIAGRGTRGGVKGAGLERGGVRSCFLTF